MKRRDIHFILMICLVFGLLIVLSLTGKPRFLPDDKAHREAVTDAACLSCHSASSDYPVSKSHPPKMKKCYLCHKKEEK